MCVCVSGLHVCMFNNILLIISVCVFVIEVNKLSANHINLSLFIQKMYYVETGLMN